MLGVVIVSDWRNSYKIAAVGCITAAIFLLPWIFAMGFRLVERAWLHGAIATELSLVGANRDVERSKSVQLRLALDAALGDAEGRARELEAVKQIIDLQATQHQVLVRAIPDLFLSSVVMRDERLVLTLRVPRRLQLLPDDRIKVVWEQDLAELGFFTVGARVNDEYECRPHEMTNHEWWHHLTLCATGDQVVPPGVMLVPPINEERS